MIKYKLKCNNCQNTFDSWFSSSKEYEKLKKQRHLSCHFCNSVDIEKTLMSPSVLRAKIYPDIEIKSKKYNRIEKKISEYQKFIKKNFDYVGKNFANEARLIHYKDKKKLKGVYGSASKEELKELKEEGIKTQIVPWLKNNIN